MKHAALLLLGLLTMGCLNSKPRPTKFYLPEGFTQPSPNLEFYPQEAAPEILFDHLEEIGGVYVDLISLTAFTELKASLPAPADGLKSDQGRLEILGPVYFDWPVVVHRKGLTDQEIEFALENPGLNLLGRSTTPPRLFLPTKNDLVLARLVEQIDAWNDHYPNFTEDSLVDLSQMSLLQGVRDAEISILTASQWEQLKNEKETALLEDYQLFTPAGPTVVAPWAVVTAYPDKAVEKNLFLAAPQSQSAPQGSRLSVLTYGKARLLAHKLFPSRYKRKSSVGESVLK